MEVVMWIGNKMEIWKPTIISHNYEVSNLGRVRSVERRGMDKRGRLTLKRSFILKPQENNPDSQIRFAFVNGTKLLPIKMIFQFRAGSENILAEIEFAKGKVKI